MNLWPCVLFRTEDAETARQELARHERASQPEAPAPPLRTTCVQLHQAVMLLVDSDQAPDPLAVLQLIERLHARLDVLPLRFGERVSNHDAALKCLECQLADLRGAMDRVRGCTELSVRLLAEAKPAAPLAAHSAPSGREYLKRRAVELDLVDGVDSRVLAEVKQWAQVRAPQGTEVAVEAPSRLAPYLRAMFLVPRASATLLSATLQTHPSDLWRGATVVGPRAPFTFASLKAPGA